MERQPQPFYIKATLMLLLLALIVSILILAKSILIPFTIAIFFTFLLLPVSRKLEQWHIPRALAILLSIILAFGLVASMIYFFYAQVLSFANDWPVLQQNLLDKWSRFQLFVSDTFGISSDEQISWISDKLKDNVSTGGELILGIFSSTTSFLASFALIPIYIFFLTLYRGKFKTFISLIAKKGKHEQTLFVVREVSMVSQKYIVGIFLDVLILTVLNSAGFLLIGLPHAILFGVLISVLNIIPYIGVLIGSALPIIMALLTFDTLGYAVAVAAVCILVQFLDNNFITPKVVGSSVSINPLTAMLVLLASSMIWGISGMILSLPLTGMAKVVFDHVEPLKPYGYLLGEETGFGGTKPSEREGFKISFGQLKTRLGKLFLRKRKSKSSEEES